MKFYGGLKILNRGGGEYYVEIDKCPFTYLLKDISFSVGEDDVPVFSATVVSSTPASNSAPFQIHIYQDGVISCDCAEGHKTDMDIYYLRTQAYNLYTFMYDSNNLEYVRGLSEAQVAGLVGRYITLKRKYDIAIKRFCDIIVTNSPVAENESKKGPSLRELAAARLQSNCKSADEGSNCCGASCGDK